MIKVILFDMDGTLIDSDELVLSIYRQLIKKYPPKKDFNSLDLGDVLASSYPDVLFKLYEEVNKEHLEEIYRLHKELKHQYLKKFSGVDFLLEKLKRKGYRLGLLTSEMRGIALDELSILKIDHYFDYVVSFDDVSKPKPDPEGINRHLDFFKCTKEEVILVGDQLSDGKAANHASIYSILMDWNHQKSLEYFTHFDHVAYDAEELLKIIEFKEKTVIKMPQDRDLNILQLTDLHLANDDKDEITYQLIEDMIYHMNPDFIVFTGDQTMSRDAVKIYKKLGKWMDQFQIPYTYVFGNHDLEGEYTYQDLIDAISTSKYLIFDQGPKYLGFSNHQIIIINSKNQTIGSLIMLDTHIDDMYLIDDIKTWGYGAISNHQIDWYKKCIRRVHYPHLIFFHIPIPEAKEVSKDDDIHIGDYYEVPCTPPINTGFFEAAKKTNKAKAMFFGHDHLNDYTYKKDNIILAYGRVSGHYDYAMPGFLKGARWIRMDEQGNVSTQVILHQDIKKRR